MFEIECLMLCQELYNKYKGNKEQARQWLEAPQQQLGGFSPLDHIQRGNACIAVNSFFAQ